MSIDALSSWRVADVVVLVVFLLVFVGGTLAIAYRIVSTIVRGRRGARHDGGGS